MARHSGSSYPATTRCSVISEAEKQWKDLIDRGGDVVGGLRKAGLPCTGIMNYRPVLEDGTSPDIERVREVLSQESHTLREHAAPTLPVKHKGGRPKGSKDKQKRKPRA